ncbi:MAG: HlyD family secretion protein [Pseudomonadota bacterium]
MLEFLICSLFTILPDYLFRRFRQGKRFGKEITVFSVWFELRYGITTCLLLTVMVITTVFYFHPTTSNVILAFRTVTILPQTGGRVAEIFVEMDEVVEAGAPIFRMEDDTQRAAVEAARAGLAQVEASLAVAEQDRRAAEGAVAQATGQRDEVQDELDTKSELLARNSNVVSEREIETLTNNLAAAQGALGTAQAQLDAVTTRITTLIPAQQRAAEAQLAEAEVQLARTIIRAGVTGRIEQFSLREGDFVSNLLRPAGILVPSDAGRVRAQAGFPQLAASVIKPGMVAEMSCATKPFTIIPMVVVAVQDVIAGGQIRPGDQLADVQNAGAPGTILVSLEPLYSNGLDGVPPGSRCVANAYTTTHEALQGDVGLLRAIGLHAVEATGAVHAAILRIHTILFPVEALVISGH